MWGQCINSLKAVVDLLLPPACLQCGNHLKHSDGLQFCKDCILSLSPLAPGHCSCCAHPFISNTSRHLCGNCLQRPTDFSKVYACGLYKGLIKEAIQGLKYRNRVILAKPLGTLFGDTFAAEITEFRPTCIIPVPLHITRLRQRSFNQSLELSWPVSQKFGIPVRKNILVRHRQTDQQQGLSAQERRKNLRDAFSVTAPVTDERVLLVDDVITTGETARACAKALVMGGAREVRVAVIGRA